MIDHLSPDYPLIMRALATKRDGVDSADLRTPNYRFRHGNRASLGVWRWLGVYEHKDFLSGLVLDDTKRGLDFGGALGPLGHDVEICDINDNLGDYPEESFDYIWTSHTLEHIDDITGTLEALQRTVKLGGTVIMHLPAWTCERWHAGRFPTFGHKHTFCLAQDVEKARGCPALIAIDTMVSNYFEVKSAEMCGDNSIFLILER